MAPIYCKAWTTAAETVQAPYNDLELLKTLKKFTSVNKSISDATFKKLKSHMWYLSEDLVGLSLFDDQVPFAVKDKMVHHMQNRDGAKNPTKRANINPTTFIDNATVADFTTKRSFNIFNSLRLPDSFLKVSSSQWEVDLHFKQAKSIANALAVVNDHAERGVALMQDYSGRLTKSEEQFQYILQVVANHRKKYPNASKQTLLGNNE